MVHSPNSDTSTSEPTLKKALYQSWWQQDQDPVSSISCVPQYQIFGALLTTAVNRIIWSQQDEENKNYR